MRVIDTNINFSMRFKIIITVRMSTIFGFYSVLTCTHIPTFQRNTLPFRNCISEDEGDVFVQNGGMSVQVNTESQPRKNDDVPFLIS